MDMAFHPAATRSGTSDEQWDDTLDALARAVASDMEHRGLLQFGAEDTVRFHFRNYARRLVNPLLDEVRAEVRAGYSEVLALEEENRRLRARMAEAERVRQQGLRRLALWSVGSSLLVLAFTAAAYFG
jgi:hypothetical protein